MVNPNQGAYNQSPGPNAYVLPPLTGYPKHDVSKWRNPAYSMGVKTDNAGKHIGPGPVYKMDQMTRYGKAYSPAAPFGIRHGQHGAAVGPGPGAYNPDMRSVGKVTKVGGTFGSRPDDAAKSVGPGPNAYVIGKDPTLRSVPGATIGGRHDPVQKQAGPGPNAYSLPPEKVKGVKFGPPPAAISNKDTGPGPGAYQSPEFLRYNPRANPAGIPFGVRTNNPVFISPEDNAMCELICRRN